MIVLQGKNNFKNHFFLDKIMRLITLLYWPNNQIAPYCSKKGLLMPFFLCTLIFTLAFTHTIPSFAMFRTLVYGNSSQPTCIEPLVKYLEETGHVPLLQSPHALAYVRCYNSLSRSQKPKETITHSQESPVSDSYEQPYVRVKHQSGAISGLLRCSRHPNKAVTCVVEITDPKQQVTQFQPANPALFELMEMAHALQSHNPRLPSTFEPLVLK